jgi:hypothetical protein
MAIQKSLGIIFFLFLSSLAFSQAQLNPNQEKIANAITEFYKLDRENIHLHLNKSAYLTSDEIWFKGYIIEKKSKKPFLPTSNVHIVLIDSKGEKVKSYLFYAENSVFEGNIKLDENINTGTYYLHVYTNYMNNFGEDESNAFEIKIINPNDNETIQNTAITDYNSITTEFYPESNVFLEGTSNTIGIKITDCNGNGITVKNGEIIDSKGITVTNFSTNDLGYGKFDILQTKNELYKAIFISNETKIEKALPLPVMNGIAFSVNNYTFENKTTLKIKTNTNSLTSYKNEPLTLVIQQDDDTSFVEFTFKENTTEQLLTLPSDNFAEGINNILLIDKNLKKIAERVIFKPAKFDRNINLKVLKTKNDSITISGSSPILMGSLSISVLPDNTKSDKNKKTIYNSFVLDNQLEGKTPKGNYFLSNFSKRKHYELDTYLICQKSKYNWQAMLIAPPQKKFDFDNGLTIKGTINKTLDNRNSYKVQLSSIPLGLNEFAEINDKNEFYFTNILASDSTTVHLSLLDKKEKSTEIKLFTQVLNNNRPFIKLFKPLKKECPTINTVDDSDYDFPKIANTIRLDSINISTTTKKPTFKNVGRHGNAMAKSFKITEADHSRDILQFIAANGYDVMIQGGTVTIVGRRSTSFMGTKSPLIYIDDVPNMDFNLLLGYSLREVDEIYINKRGYGGGMEAANGVIRIYTKKGVSGYQKFSINSQSFLVKNGFQPAKRFTNPKYTSFSSDGFKDFGTIHWEPYVETDENGVFNFSMPNLNQKSVQITIEGISSDGQLISETKIIEIP